MQIIIFPHTIKFSRRLPLTVFLITILFSAHTKLFAQSPRQTVLFNNDWKFHKGDTTNADKKNFNDKDWRTLDLPHDWSIEGPFDKKWASSTAFLPAGIGWYRKSFAIDAAMRNKKIYIYFDGVNNNSEVWINGHYLGKRPNGFIPFEYELTDYLNLTGKNTLSVKVDHSRFADSRWYSGSGIYRNVYLIATNNVSIDLWGVGFSTPLVSESQAMANVDVALTNHSTKGVDLLVQSRLISPYGRAVDTRYQLIKLAAGKNTKNNCDSEKIRYYTPCNCSAGRGSDVE